MTRKHTNNQIQEKLSNSRVKYGNQENITLVKKNSTILLICVARGHLNNGFFSSLMWKKNSQARELNSACRSHFLRLGYARCYQGLTRLTLSIFFQILKLEWWLIQLSNFFKKEIVSRHQVISVLYITINCIRWWGFGSEALENLKSPILWHYSLD